MAWRPKAVHSLHSQKWLEYKTRIFGYLLNLFSSGSSYGTQRRVEPRHYLEEGQRVKELNIGLSLCTPFSLGNHHSLDVKYGNSHSIAWTHSFKESIPSHPSMILSRRERGRKRWEPKPLPSGGHNTGRVQKEGNRGGKTNHNVAFFPFPVSLRVWDFLKKWLAGSWIPHSEPPCISKPIWSLAMLLQNSRRPKQGVAWDYAIRPNPGLRLRHKA